MRTWATMALGAALCGAAAAQDPDTPVAVGDAVTVTARTGALTPLPSGQPVPVELQVVEVEGAPADVPVDVTLRGFARLVELDGRRIGQAVTDRVARADREASIEGSGLTAQFDLAGPSLAADRDVELRGDRAALLRALREVAGADGEDAAAPDERAGGAQGAGPAPSPASSGGGGGNPEASDYRTPERPASEQEPQIAVEVTSEGCAVRVDLAQGVAVQQSRSVTTEDGRAMDRSECSDSSVRYPLRKDYGGCEDSVNLSAGEARPGFRWVYDDGAGRRQVASAACEPDPDLAYEIVEDHGRCDVSVDLAAGRATPQAALVYVNRANARVAVRGCAASKEKPAITMRRDASGCPAVPDRDAGVARQLATWTYTLDGVSYRVGSCAASDATWRLQRSYGECADEVDLDRRLAWPQFKLFYIDGGGASHTVSGACEPDSSAAFRIEEKHDRCGVGIDLAGERAIPQSALAYRNRGGAETVVRGCRASETRDAVALVRDAAGCPARAGAAGTETVQLAKWTYTLDGVKHDAGACEATDTAFAHVKSFDADCADEVDIGAKTARPRFRWTWTDAEGVRHSATAECVVDTSVTWAVTEDHASCAAALDFEAGLATPQAALVYANGDGDRVEARGCEASGSKAAVALVRDPAGYGIVDDPGARESVRHAKWVYVLDGTRHEVGGCAPTDTRFAHFRHYDDCADAVDLTRREARARFEWAYEADGATHKASDSCEDDDRVFPIVEDHARCGVSIDRAAKRVTPQAALVYRDRNGAAVEARGCAASATKPAVALALDATGCPVVDGTAGTHSVRHAKRVYVLDGTRHEDGGCEATDTQFAHFKHYADCADAVDLTRREAQARFEWAYEADGATHKVSDSCEDDDTVFPIVEDHGRCGVSIDRTAKLVTPQAVLVYRGRNGALVEARGCAASGSKAAVALVMDATGCPVVHGTAGTHSVRHAKRVYVLDGTRHEDSGCEATDTQFAHEKDYDCRDAIDLTARKARPRFKWFYADGDGAPRYLTGRCVTESETEFPITEDHGRCSIAVDASRGLAIPQSALIYANRDGVTEEARACRASETRAAIAMTVTTAGCSIRHDFAAGRSVQLAMWTYTLQGVTYQAAGCSDTTTVYRHEIVYRNGGAWICARRETQSPRRVILQSRVRISVGGVGRYITGCAADASGRAVASTTSGCTDASKWRHDLAAGRSYGQKRFYFTHGSARYWLGGCVESTTTYAHSVTTVGWENRDAQLYALPKSKVTIAAPGGTYVIVASRVLAGAARRPYALQRTENVPNGGVSYTGCTARTTTNRVEVYSRPDGSGYRKQVGAGSPTSPRNACRAEVGASWPRVDRSYVAHSRTGDCSIAPRCRLERPSYCRGCPMSRVCTGGEVKSTYAHSSRYRGTRTMRREDGHAVSSVTATRTWRNSSTYCHAGAEGSVTLANKAPEAVTDTARINAWRTELGW